MHFFGVKFDLEDLLCVKDLTFCNSAVQLSATSQVSGFINSCTTLHQSRSTPNIFHKILILTFLIIPPIHTTLTLNMTCGRLWGSGETHGSGGPFDSVGPSGTNFLAAVDQENDPPHPTTEIYYTKNLNNQKTIGHTL